MASALTVGVLRVVLHLPASGSLKSKRQVVAALLRRVQNEFRVAAAEVGDGNHWQIAELGIACISNDSQHADEVLQKIASFIEARATEAVVASVTTELLRL